MSVRKEEFLHVVEDPQAIASTQEEDINVLTFLVQLTMSQKVDANIDADSMMNPEDAEPTILHVFVAQCQYPTIFLLLYPT